MQVLGIELLTPVAAWRSFCSVGSDLRFNLQLGASQARICCAHLLPTELSSTPSPSPQYTGSSSCTCIQPAHPSRSDVHGHCNRIATTALEIPATYRFLVCVSLSLVCFQPTFPLHVPVVARSNSTDFRVAVWACALANRTHSTQIQARHHHCHHAPPYRALSLVETYRHGRWLGSSSFEAIMGLGSARFASKTHRITRP